MRGIGTEERAIAKMVNTSYEALISISHIRGKLKREVFAALRAFGWDGATCEELERSLSMKHQTLSARVRELWTEGWVNRVGERRTRSGRWATVYRARKRRKNRKPRDRCRHCGQVLVKR